jgi:hypothetical protein
MYGAFQICLTICVRVDCVHFIGRYGCAKMIWSLTRRNFFLEPQVMNALASFLVFVRRLDDLEFMMVYETLLERVVMDLPSMDAV